jgi:formylglycine-generating enzyme
MDWTAQAQGKGIRLWLASMVDVRLIAGSACQRANAAFQMMNDKNPDPMPDHGANEEASSTSTQPAILAAATPVSVVSPPRESKLWIVVVVAIVVAILGLLATPMIRRQLAERDRDAQVNSRIIEARNHLGEGRFEAAESSAREVLRLLPGNEAANSILAEAGKHLGERLEREKRGQAALAAAEKSAAEDQIVTAITAFEEIIAKPAQFPENSISIARERLAALRESTGTLTLPADWPGDALISIDGRNQTPTGSMITGIPLGARTIGITRKGFRNPPGLKLDFKGIRPLGIPSISWNPVGGKVTLTSNPPGASVWIGGINTGRVTPATFEEVDVGKVEYLLKLPRHADTVVQGEVASLATLPLSTTLTETSSLPVDGKQAGERRIFNVAPDLRIAFRWCPPGTFSMGGSDRAAANAEKPVRKVRLTQGFWLGETEFTQKQWAAIEGRQSLLMYLSNRPRSKPLPDGQDLPMLSVSWDQICGNKNRNGGVLGKINAFFRNSKITQWTADLPTEAQWEYACRAGTSGPFSTKSPGSDLLDRSAWHQSNSDGMIHPVGLKEANPWGFHDMHGNAREWTRSWYQESYAKLPDTDPVGPSSGWKVALRGGSFLTSLAECRSSARAQAYSSISHPSVGYRLILRKPEAAPPVVSKPSPKKVVPPKKAPPAKKKPAPKKPAPKKKGK